MSDAFATEQTSNDQANEVPAPPYSPAYDLATARAEAIEWRQAAERGEETARQLRAELDRMTTLYREARIERERFGERVVAVAQQVGEEQGWCREGQSRYLAMLDLELPCNRWSGSVTVTVQFSGIEADDEDDAENRVREYVDSARVYGADSWDIDDVSIEPDEDY